MGDLKYLTDEEHIALWSAIMLADNEMSDDDQAITEEQGLRYVALAKAAAESLGYEWRDDAAPQYVQP